MFILILACNNSSLIFNSNDISLVSLKLFFIDGTLSNSYCNFWGLSLLPHLNQKENLITVSSIIIRYLISILQ